MHYCWGPWASFKYYRNLIILTLKVHILQNVFEILCFHVYIWQIFQGIVYQNFLDQKFAKTMALSSQRCVNYPLNKKIIDALLICKKLSYRMVLPLFAGWILLWISGVLWRSGRICRMEKVIIINGK